MNLEAFKTEVVSRKNKLYRFAMQFLGNAEEAEDTVQEVMIKLWAMKEKLDTYHSVEALAMQMTKNKCLNQLKSAKNHVSVEKLNGQESTGYISPDKALEQLDTKKMIGLALSQLPEIQQTILKLRDIEEYEFEEIAAILQKDEAYIRVNLGRARKKMSELLMNQNKNGKAGY